MLCCGGLHKCRFEVIYGGWKWNLKDLRGRITTSIDDQETKPNSPMIQGKKRTSFVNKEEI